jgi:hypothetical protein
MLLGVEEERKDRAILESGMSKASEKSPGVKETVTTMHLPSLGEANT